MHSKVVVGEVMIAVDFCILLLAHSMVFPAPAGEDLLVVSSCGSCVFVTCACVPTMT